MSNHLILYHSQRQLKKWGINRQYLKYTLGMIDRDQMRKGISFEMLNVNNSSARQIEYLGNKDKGLS